MTWAETVYAVWALVALLALCSWLVSRKGWKIAGARVAGPLVVVRRILGAGTWVRVGAVAVWIWLGVHLFAR